MSDEHDDIYEEVDAATNEAIDRAGAGVSEEWKDAARLVVQGLIDTGEPFSPDDVWDLKLEQPRDKRALGYIVREFARAGAIVKTGRKVKSRYVSQHGNDLNEWARFGYKRTCNCACHD